MGNIIDELNVQEKFVDTVFNDSFVRLPYTLETIDDKEISQQVNYIFETVCKPLTDIKLN